MAAAASTAWRPAPPPAAVLAATGRTTGVTPRATRLAGTGSHPAGHLHDPSGWQPWPPPSASWSNGTAAACPTRLSRRRTL